MKKLLPIVSLLLLSYNVLQAQTEKGTFMFNGGSTFSFTSDNSYAEFDGEKSDYTNKTTTLNISFKESYFVVDGLAIGVELGYSRKKQNYLDYIYGGSTSETTNIQNQLYVGPSVKYYLLLGNFAPFVGISGGYILTKSEFDFEYDPDNIIIKRNGLFYGGELGLAYFINKNVSVDFLIDYDRNITNHEDRDDMVYKNNQFNFGFGFSVYLN